MKPRKISIRPLQNGKYQLSYVHPKTGKRTRKRFDTFAQARDYENHLKSTVFSQNGEQYKELLVSELMKIHFQKCPDTMVDARRIPYDQFMDIFGQYKIKDLTTFELKEWMKNIQMERDYAEITMLHIKGHINHFFNYLIDEGIINYSPLNTIKFNRSAPPKKPRVFMTSDEIKIILDNTKKYSPNYLYPFFMGLVHTGARRSEMVNLTWDRVDMQENTLHIKDAKGGTIRIIKMSPPLRKLIETLPRTCKYVFTNPDGEMIGRSQLTRHIKSVKFAFPFHKDWNCHAFRHSFAYNFLKRGGQMYELMAILGHKSIGLTINLYGKLRSEDVEDPSPFKF